MRSKPLLIVLPLYPKLFQLPLMPAEKPCNRSPSPDVGQFVEDKKTCAFPLNLTGTLSTKPHYSITHGRPLSEGDSQTPPSHLVSSVVGCQQPQPTFTRLQYGQKPNESALDLDRLLG